MESFQRAMIPVQKFFRAHPVWFKNHIVCVIPRPVAVYYPVFGIQFIVKACAGVWCKYRKIGYLKFCLDGKVNRSIKNPFIIMVKTKDKGAVNSNTVIMHLFDNIKIIIRLVKALPHPRKIVSGEGFKPYEKPHAAALPAQVQYFIIPCYVDVGLSEPFQVIWDDTPQECLRRCCIADYIIIN